MTADDRSRWSTVVRALEAASSSPIEPDQLINAYNRFGANSVGIGIHELNENDRLSRDSISGEDLAVWRDHLRVEKDRYALEELLFLAFSRNKFPFELVNHLIKSLLPLRSSDVLVAREALGAISYFIPLNENTVDKEDEAYLYHLRAIDSLFPDMEEFLLRVMLSDDDTVESQYWYVSMRHCVKAVFALSADIDYVVSRILGKAMWYAHRSAQLLILYKEGSPPSIDRSEYWNTAWQKTTERLLMLIVEVIQSIFVYVDNYFPKLLKRAMTLDEKCSEELEKAVEPYADFNKDHFGIEMDLAYREDLFARAVTSIAKSKAEGGDSTSPELGSALEKAADKAANELGFQKTILIPRGTLPDAALCPLNRKRADANKGQHKCREEGERFRQLPLLVDGKPLDIVVEKMCQRFQFCSSGEAIEHNKNIAYYFSYFISQLILSNTSFYKEAALKQIEVFELAMDQQMELLFPRYTRMKGVVTDAGTGRRTVLAPSGGTQKFQLPPKVANSGSLSLNSTVNRSLKGSKQSGENGHSVSELGAVYVQAMRMLENMSMELMCSDMELARLADIAHRAINLSRNVKKNYFPPLHVLRYGANLSSALSSRTSLWENRNGIVERL
ncbi:unnamed protein product [Angiostrongylus costaricensis]|uniref:PH domain-containing protein n=1 Tax=Angiostrongylus costaricensis TaxID=334426 RepID=A0A158PFQ8_ANGCS|nr:unnamed protein product [Angiostrongylus costaricensis]